MAKSDVEALAKKIRDRVLVSVTVTVVGQYNDGTESELGSAPLDLGTGYHCEACDATSAESLDEPIYECGECSDVFSRSNSANGESSLCPNCNKFSSKVSDVGCTECNAGPVEEVMGFACPHCNEFVQAEDLADHFVSCTG